MKRIPIALFVIIILLTFSSCTSEEKENITEALKISTWLMDTNLEGTGYWSYDENISAHGRVSNESDEQIHHDDVFI